MLRAIGAASIHGHVLFHDLRHTAYTQIKEALSGLYDPKMALADIRLLFGHADVTMDRVYDHRTVDRLRKLISVTPLAPAVAGILRPSR